MLNVDSKRITHALCIIIFTAMHLCWHLPIHWISGHQQSHKNNPISES